jgi:hypothetical protein
MLSKNSALYSVKFSEARDIWRKLNFWQHGIVFFLLTLPFAFWRHIRIHGDEKVYVAQALEMVRAGHLWQQLQFGDINYIKGPSHYLLLIIGHHLFGFSPLSITYMNLILGACAVTALRLSSEFLLPAQSRLKGLAGLLFATSGAFVMFTFSSQMDSALTSLYAITMSLAVAARYTGATGYFLLLWLTVGFAGTLKSPLHSCLLGISVVAYFSFGKPSIRSLFGSSRKILSLFAGVCLTAAGYVLPFFLDRENWFKTYIFREQFDRPRFSDSAFVFLFNNFFVNLAPWSFLVVPCCLIAYRRMRKGILQFDRSSALSLAFLLPTFLFFFGLGYRAPWYGLPMIPAIIVLLVGQLQAIRGYAGIFAKVVLPFSVLMILAVAGCHFAFFGGAPWWTSGHTLALLTSFILSVVSFESVISRGRLVSRATAMLSGLVFFWFGTLGLTATLGESELSDARELLSEHRAPLNYDNTRRENFNEWGMMAYMLGVSTHFSNTHADLMAAGLKGQWLVFTSQQDLDSFWTWMKLNNAVELKALRPSVNVWRRWPRNATQMREIWLSRASTENTWDKATRHFLLVRFTNATSSVSVNSDLGNIER